MLGEFVGTYLFLFFAFAGAQVANTPPNDQVDTPASTSTLLYIALAFGFSLAVNVWIFFRISGGLFNPAVTIALALVGAIDWLKAGLLTVSQVVAGIAAAGVVSALFPGPLVVRTTLSQTTSITRGLFIEMLLTAELIFCIFMLAAEKHKATFLAPIGIGLALFIAELAGEIPVKQSTPFSLIATGVYFTGGSLNPARSFGPDVVLHTFDGYHWIYWIGPLLGAIVAVLFYRLIKILEYETANPGADSDGQEGRYNDSGEYDAESRHASRRTDGTNESIFSSPIHLMSQPIPGQHISAFSQENSASTTAESYAMPTQPQSMYHYGGDGHHSRVHSSDRSHRRHRRSSTSSRSHYEMSSAEHSFRSGPSIESAEHSGSSTSHRSRSSH
ncbi:aquaporin-like protein [Corynespora cassiicola Philippines]|uniref:Aquaporin-like protein n=1 Tax=Corynespora cassiicola Philippines TaxID=1448308 RepID=A0A2T2NY56_CORCC|nr:aquaporin-like protein [Corynespora cassiicola Philippines]